jgi:hypothetical protein
MAEQLFCQKEIPSAMKNKGDIRLARRKIEQKVNRAGQDFRIETARTVAPL